MSTTTEGTTRYVLIDPVGMHLGIFDTEAEAWAWADANATARGAHIVRPETNFERLVTEDLAKYLSREKP